MSKGEQMSNDTDKPPPEQTTGGKTVSGGTEKKDSDPLGPWEIRAMGIGLVVLSLLLAHMLLMLWPSGLQTDSQGDSTTTVMLLHGWIVFYPSLDMRLIMLVMVAGGLGSFIHTATSFGDYVGNESLSRNWIWWYILRPFIGMVLAVIFYLVIRGGFLSAGTEAGNINPFGIAALAGLVGMFSKQAADKLNEVFNTLFRAKQGEGDDKRKDSLTNPRPTVTEIDPTSVEPKTNNLNVIVKGTGFVEGATVRIAGTSRDTEFVSEAELRAKLLETDVEKEGDLEIAVFNPGPGGGLSTPIKLKIAAKGVQ